MSIEELCTAMSIVAIVGLIIGFICIVGHVWSMRRKRKEIHHWHPNQYEAEVGVPYTDLSEVWRRAGFHPIRMGENDFVDLSGLIGRTTLSGDRTHFERINWKKEGF